MNIKRNLYQTVLLIFSTVLVYSQNNNASIKLNQNYIEEIMNTQKKVEVTKPLDVFEFVFNFLPEEVTVYPSENYFYYEFINQGVTYQGNIGLFRDTLEKNSINFGYYIKSGHVFEEIGDIFKYSTLDKKDGVIVQNIDTYKSTITYNNKTVTFNFYKFNLEENNKLKLRPNEILIAPTLDESGIAFYLIYNTYMKRFYWVLNEHSMFNEKLIKYNNDLSFSKRTDFIYLNDIDFDRKVLIGVNYYNIRKNNWFDGPFDQMPDNIICNGNTILLPYLKEAFPSEANNFDKFGNYLNDEDSRIAISSYTTYLSFNNIKTKVSTLRLENSTTIDIIERLTAN